MIWGKRNAERDRYERIFCWLPTQLRDGRWMWLDHCYKEVILGETEEYHAENPADAAHRQFIERCRQRYGGGSEWLSP